MNIKTILKSSVAAAALFAMTAPTVAPTAEAGAINNGNKNSLKISGYVTKSLMYADDGDRDHLFIVDGATSESRIRWVAKGTLNENVSAGAMIELEIPLSNQQDTATLAATNTAGGDIGESVTDVSLWGIRHQFVWIFHKKFGKISLGQTNAANNGGAEASLSGTSGIDLSGYDTWGEGVRFVETTGGVSALSRGVTVGSSFNNLDATSRTDVVRYDLPKFGGFGLAVSLNGGGSGEIGAKFSRKFGPVKLLVKGGYSNTSATKTGTENIVTVSGAVLHDSGLNASITYSEAEQKSATRNDKEHFSAAIGYQAKVFGVGGTNFNIVYAKSEEQNLNGDDAEVKGFTIVQKLDPIGAFLGLSYRNYELDRTVGTYDDVDVVAFTTLFNF